MKRIGNIGILSLWAFLLCTVSVAAQSKEISFVTKLSKTKVGINERLRVDFVVNRDGDNFTPPDFQGFRIVGGPNQSINASWVNGKKTYSRTYSYFLSPKTRGKFTIRQATIEIGGQTYKTLPVTVEITTAVEKSENDDGSGTVLDENLHLVAEVSKGNPYLNEAITVIYKLYVGPSIRVTNYNLVDSPKYKNFWSQDIPIKRVKEQSGYYQGQPYRYVVLKRVVLYPQKSGALKIEPLSLDIRVEVPTNRRSFFGRVYTPKNKIVAAGRRTIKVKELPEVGKPENFTGAVGNFNFKVKASKTELKASESFQLNVELRGSGNLKLIDLPEMSLPSALEVYEPQYKENVKTNLSGMSGKISENYTVVPAYRGKYPINPLSFSYFDPKTETYKTETSEALVVEVLDGPQNRDSNESALVQAQTKKNIITSGHQFRFLKLQPGLHIMNREIFFGSTIFYILLTTPLLLIPLAILLGKKREARASDVEGNRIRLANRLAKKYLSEAKKALNSKDSFYISLERALHNYLKAKLKIKTADFSKEKIKELLQARKVKKNPQNRFVDLLESCERARYGASTESKMQGDYEKAVNLIAEIDKQF